MFVSNNNQPRKQNIGNNTLKEIVSNHIEWKKDYIYNQKNNIFKHHFATAVSTQTDSGVG
jgi:hypothetical protein